MIPTYLDFHQIWMLSSNYRLTTTICTGNDPNLLYTRIGDIRHLRQLLFLIDNKLINSIAPILICNFASVTGLFWKMEKSSIFPPHLFFYKRHDNL